MPTPDQVDAEIKPGLQLVRVDVAHFARGFVAGVNDGLLLGSLTTGPGAPRYDIEAPSPAPVTR